MVSRLGLLPSAMTGSMFLLKLKSVLMSVNHVAIKITGMPGVWATSCGHFGVQGPYLCIHQGI